MEEPKEDRVSCATMLLVAVGIWTFIIVAIVKMCN